MPAFLLLINLTVVRTIVMICLDVLYLMTHLPNPLTGRATWQSYFLHNSQVTVGAQSQTITTESSPRPYRQW